MIWRRIFLALVAAYFALPLVMTTVFSLWQGKSGYGFAAYRALMARGDLAGPFVTSLALSAATVALLGLLLVPAMIAAHLFAPRLRGVLETAAVLPFVVPAIALVAGLSALIRGPGWLIGSPAYLVIPFFFLALPYAFRAVELGLSSLDLPQLRLAAASLGAGPGRMILWVVLPNLGPALLNAALMTFTIVMGEFTISNILLFQTFPVSINLIGKSDPAQAAALSMISFLLTWAALLGVLMATHRPAKAPQ